MTFGYPLRVATLLLWSLALGAVAQVGDGPYLLKAQRDGWIAHWVDDTAQGPAARRDAVAADGRVMIGAVGQVPAFQVQLRAPVRDAGAVINTAENTPLLVVADTHGEYEIFVQLLQRQRIIDEQLGWAFGPGHLVVLGDVFDRGAHQLEILWLLYQLQAEAEAVGGGVELLIGNHEAMVLRGDLRYLHPRYRVTARALGVPSYATLFDADSLLGQWLRSRAAVLKFDDALLLHGGISPEVVARGMSVQQLNQAVRQVLRDQADSASSELHDVVMRTHGPLWYRGYFPLDGAKAEVRDVQVDAMLHHFDVSTILVGHTKVPKVTPLYEGKVIAVQVYPERDPQTGAAVMEAVRRDGGHWYRVGVDGLREALR